MTSERNQDGKKVIYEASMRVPLIVRWPEKLAEGQVVDPSVDTMPTLLDLCGIAIPNSLQGTSSVLLLNGKAESVQEAIYYENYYEKLKTSEEPEKIPIPERRGALTIGCICGHGRDHKGCLI
jgi:arylsulfatase A-like enzyme